MMVAPKTLSVTMRMLIMINIEVLILDVAIFSLIIIMDDNIIISIVRRIITFFFEYFTIDMTHKDSTVKFFIQS